MSPYLKDAIDIIAGRLCQVAEDEEFRSAVLALAQTLLGQSPNSEPSTNAKCETDSELLSIAARCRLKAKGCRWAVERDRMKRDGAEHSVEIAPTDIELLDAARQLPDCNLWTNRPSFVLPEQLSRCETLAGCFEALAMTLETAEMVVKHDVGTQSELKLVLQLVAEAQSALRLAVARVSGPTDSEQTSAFRWLKAMTEKKRLFVERFMRIEDIADPELWRDLICRCDDIRSQLRTLKVRDRLHCRLLEKLTYQLSLLSQTDDDDYKWLRIATTVDDMVQAGVPPSNLELRKLLSPVLEDAPELDKDTPTGFKLAVRETQRLQDIDVQEDKSDPVSGYPPEVKTAAMLLKGKKVALIGGDAREHTKVALESALELKELLWAERGTSVSSLAPYVARPEVAAVLLAIRWSPHSYGDVKKFCDRYEKPLVWLPGGMSVTQVAFQIMTQCGDRLRAASESKTADTISQNT
ncbi:MAG: hypothetical protein NXI28_12450 [bacterium]|nr:hypothetical protein [bacterium]